jgi:hypothetical protein
MARNLRNIISREATQNYLICFLLIILVWLAKYSLSADFGFYEDDYTRIPRVMVMDLPDLLNRIFESFWNFVDHGKPLHASLLYSLTYIGNRIAGLRGIYLIGYLIVATNAVLFFVLIKKLFGVRFALLAGLAFALFSADTTQALLTHALGLQTSLTFTLLAMHSYLSRRKFLVFLFSFLVLINYEVPFPLFIAFPLMEIKWDRQWLKNFMFYIGMIGVVLAVYLGIRYVSGESRVAELSYPEIFTTPLTHMFQGPFVSLGTYFYRPVQAISEMGGTGYIVTLLLAPVLYVVIHALSPNEPLDLRALQSTIKTFFKASDQGVEELPLETATVETKTIIRATIFGIASITLAYMFTFTVRAYAISGRETRVHLAAAIGASILLAVFGTLLIKLTKRFRVHWIGVGFMSALFSLLIGFGFVVQRDYARSWDLQQDFWSQVVDLTPDIEKGTVILIEPTGLAKTKFIDANTWNMPRILNNIYTFPEYWEWHEEPRVYWLWPTWREMIWIDGTTMFRIDEATTLPPTVYFKTAQIDDVILLEMQEGKLVRVGPELIIEGIALPLKPIEEISSPRFPYGVLFPLLIDEESLSW